MKDRSIARDRTGLAGLIVVLLISFGLFAIVLHQAQLKKQDDRTQQAAYAVEDKLSNYVYNKQMVPESLAAAGIKKVPQGLTYKKVNRTTYKFCVTYRSSYNFSYHKGVNCQPTTVYLTPPPAFVKNGDNTYTVCGIQAGYFSLDGFIVPPTVNTPNVVDINNQIYMFSAESRAFDEQCNELKQSDLHVGDKVDVFDKLSSTNNTPAVSTFLKRS
jgi:hypothetical protein